MPVGVALLSAIGFSLSLSAIAGEKSRYKELFKTSAASLPLSLDVRPNETIIVYFSNLKGEDINVGSWVDFIAHSSITDSAVDHKVTFSLDSLRSTRYEYIASPMNHLSPKFKKQYDDEIKKLIDENGGIPKQALYEYSFSFPDSENVTLRGGGLTSGLEPVHHLVRNEEIGQLKIIDGELLKLEIPIISNEPNSRMLVVLRGKTELIVAKSIKEKWNMTENNCKFIVFAK